MKFQTGVISSLEIFKLSEMQPKSAWLRLLMTHFTSNYYTTYYLRSHGLAAYLPAVIHYHTHFLFTIITHVGGSNWVNTGPMKHQHQAHSNPRKTFLTTEHYVQIYSNQKQINYFSPSNIRASVETRPLKPHN